MSDPEVRRVRDPALRMELSGLKSDRALALRRGDVDEAKAIAEAIREVRREVRATRRGRVGPGDGGK